MENSAVATGDGSDELGSAEGRQSHQPERSESNKKAKISEPKTKVAIIVPFRDLDPEQKRQSHLERFVPYVNEFFQDSEVSLRVYIIEQTDDGRKFNRGKLLNIGFVLAEREGCDVMIFHDVDLLPRASLKQWYFGIPQAGEIFHIAQCWNRYNQSKTYLGGIVSFSKEDFKRIDGFPNTYWGWGGEDDELSKRVREARIRIIGPDRYLKDAIIDMEEMNLKEKLDWLRARRHVKCEVKWEVNDNHDKYRNVGSKPRWWGVAGLTKDGDQFRVTKRDDNKYENCSLITVDVGANRDDDGNEYLVQVKDNH